MTTQERVDQGTTILTAPRSRRDMLKVLGLGLALPAAASVLNACGGAPATTAAPATKDGMAMGAATTATPAIDMDAMHEAGIKAFPAKTASLGNQPLQPRIENGVKIFDLTCKVVQWEVTPGKMEEAYTYNGMVPGPEIRVTQGDTVRINVKNELPQST